MDDAAATNMNAGDTAILRDYERTELASDGEKNSLRDCVITRKH